MASIGDKLLQTAKTVRRDVSLIAPFIKKYVLNEVFSAVPSEVPIRVIGRWIPAEIAAGACDLEIYDLVSERPRSELYVHSLLHAKYYRFDDHVFFGSANLTRKALGWAAPSNIEILHGPVDVMQEYKQFEEELLRSAFRVDATYRDLIKSKVDKIMQEPLHFENLFEGELRHVEQAWLPTCRVPYRIWQVYSIGETARRLMVETAFEAATADLKVLGIESGLYESQFNTFVASTLIGMPLVQEINAVAQVGLSNEAAVTLIETANKGEPYIYTADEMWEVLQAWLLYYFPTQYRREAASEIFKKGRIIG